MQQRASRTLGPGVLWAAGLGAVALIGVLWLNAGGRTDTAIAGEDQRNSAEASNVGTGVEVVPVELQDLSRTIEMPGTVQGYETIDLHAKIGGYLREMRVDIGDSVEKGQVLAILSVPEMDQQLKQKQALVQQAVSLVDQARAVIAQAEAEGASAQAMLHEAQAERAEKDAQLRHRQAEHNRYQELVDSRAARRDLLDEARYQLEAAQAARETVEARIRTAEAKLHAAGAKQKKVAADYESSQAAVAVAESDLQQVQTMLQYAEIRAAFDGYVTDRYVDPGAFIQPAEGNSGASPLLTITRTDKVRIVLDIPMGEVRFLDRGDPAVLDRVNVLPGEQPFKGVVARFSPSLNKSSRMMRLEIDLENPDGKLLPGYYGYVTLNLQQLAGTPVIPNSAVMTEGDQAFVYLVEDGTCRRCPITPTYQDGSIVGVSSGLVGGEQVIVSGGAQLVEGQRVSSIVSGAKRG